VRGVYDRATGILVAVKAGGCQDLPPCPTDRASWAHIVRISVKRTSPDDFIGENPEGLQQSVQAARMIR
jgi:hypothetical protein